MFQLSLFQKASIRAAAVALAAIAALSSTGMAEEPDYIAGEIHGMTIFALHPDSDRIGNVRTTDAETALQAIGAAIDLAYRRSPFTRERIDMLQGKGDIQFLYDARHPEDVMTEVNIASFVPKFYDPDQGEHVFLVLIGRTGIQWSSVELAAAVAHELAGHAYQRMEGRLLGMRILDAECEAYLVHEQANQDIGADKTTDEAIALRQATDYHWCDDFRRWTLAEGLTVADEWDALNPNVPALLNAFKSYIAEQE
ncbi:MAG: hypothetical protein R8L07_08290 [Alphaproteobacteria bacterium]|nr:hypothetical protein [Alphaproteobacteria bacterium]